MGTTRFAMIEERSWKDSLETAHEHVLRAERVWMQYPETPARKTLRALRLGLKHLLEMQGFLEKHIDVGSAFVIKYAQHMCVAPHMMHAPEEGSGAFLTREGWIVFHALHDMLETLEALRGMGGYMLGRSSVPEKDFAAACARIRNYDPSNETNDTV